MDAIDRLLSSGDDDEQNHSGDGDPSKKPALEIEMTSMHPGDDMGDFGDMADFGEPSPDEHDEADQDDSARDAMVVQVLQDQYPQIYDKVCQIVDRGHNPGDDSPDQGSVGTY